MDVDEAMAEARRIVDGDDPLEPIGSHGMDAMTALVAEVERLRAAETYFTERDRATAWRAGAEAMRDALAKVAACAGNQALARALQDIREFEIAEAADEEVTP